MRSKIDTSEGQVRRIFSSSGEDADQAVADYRTWVYRSMNCDEEWISVMDGGTARIRPGAPRHHSRYIGWHSLDPSQLDRPLTIKVVTMPVNSPLLMACAQDLFASFFAAVSTLIHELGGITTWRQNSQNVEDSWEFLLQNSLLDEIADIFCRSGLGSMEDAYGCIIPPLRLYSKMPLTEDIFEDAQRVAANMRMDDKWQDCALLMKWIYNSASKLDLWELRELQIDLGEHFKMAVLHADKDIQTVGYDGVLWMLSSGSKIEAGIADRYAWFAVRQAHIRERTDMKELLIKAGADEFLYQPSRELLKAIMMEPKTVLKLLLEQEGSAAPPSVREQQLPWVGGKLDAAMVTLLLPSRVDVPGESIEPTPLHKIATNGNTELLRFMLQSGIEADTRDADGRTPLSWAAQKGHKGVVMLLLRENVDVNSEDAAGRTPLSWAAQHGQEVVAERLIKKIGMNTKQCDKSRRTPLSWAAESGHPNLAKLILSCNDTLRDITDAQNRTPLFIAAEKGHYEVVKLLVDSQADIDTADNLAWTPLHRSIAGGHQEIVRL